MKKPKTQKQLGAEYFSAIKKGMDNLGIEFSSNPYSESELNTMRRIGIIGTDPKLLDKRRKTKT